jgi:hypothetical protein
MSLSDEDRGRLRAEEIFRAEVQRSLCAPKSQLQRLLAFLNSSLGLWILSALFITGLSTTYSAWSAKQAERRRSEDAIRRLDIEIAHRIESISIIGDGVVTFTQLHSAKAALRGASEARPEVGELGDYRPIFIEFNGRSLFSLIWELQRTLPQSERVAVQPALTQARRLEVAFSWMERGFSRR